MIELASLATLVLFCNHVVSCACIAGQCFQVVRRGPIKMGHFPMRELYEFLHLFQVFVSSEPLSRLQIISSCYQRFILPAD